MPECEEIPRAAAEDTVIPAGGSWSRRIDKGQVLGSSIWRVGRPWISFATMLTTLKTGTLLPTR